ncbi:hypothetical protein F8388_002800, partial [Cannabis sativa]
MKALIYSSLIFAFSTWLLTPCKNLASLSNKSLSLSITNETIASSTAISSSSSVNQTYYATLFQDFYDNFVQEQLISKGSDHLHPVHLLCLVTEAHVEEIKKTHLRDLMNDAQRCHSMMVEFGGLLLDYLRQNATLATIEKLFKLAETANLKHKINQMFGGEHINSTENRSVLHVALRAPRDTVIQNDGKNVVQDIWKVLDKIQELSERVCNGSWVGATGLPLTDVVAVGPSAVARHMVAVSTNLMLVEKFGIDPNNAFTFWDGVGGRYSVCSAVGVLPLSLQYGFQIVEKYHVSNAITLFLSSGERFLKGASSIDRHFHSAPYEKNIPASAFRLVERMECFISWISCKSQCLLLLQAILPYSQALEKFAPHIQQVSMESNGKGVSIDGVPLPYEAGEIDFDEPGTNGQHSFYQLIHQGRIIPCDFIGVVKSQQPVYLKGEVVSNHDELMSNIFAQPDTLAYGKTIEQLQKENVAEHLVPHKVISLICRLDIVIRPSLSLLLPSLTAYNVGQWMEVATLIARAMIMVVVRLKWCCWVVAGAMVVELEREWEGKQLHASRTKSEPVEGFVEGFNFRTATLLRRYLE